MKPVQVLIFFIVVLTFLIVLGIMIMFASSLSGCATAIEAEQKIADHITAIDDKTHSVLGIVATSGKVIHIVSELHKAGVDKEVIQTINNAMNAVHKIAEKEHQKHVKRE